MYNLRKYNKEKETCIIKYNIISLYSNILRVYFMNSYTYIFYLSRKHDSRYRPNVYIYIYIAFFLK